MANTLDFVRLKYPETGEKSCPRDGNLVWCRAAAAARPAKVL